MTLAETVLGVMFVGLIAYGLFGGADFGAGIWDLLAGGTRRGARQRDLIEHSIGPVWEANHVWLIFVLVVLWTAFSGPFVAVATTLYIPLTLAAFGMIARGAAFAFRKSVTTLRDAALPRRRRSPCRRWSRPTSSARWSAGSPPGGCRPASPQGTSSRAG